MLALVLAARGLAAGTDEAVAPGVDPNLDAAEADDAQAPQEKHPWNMYDGRFFTARIGAGFLYDYADFIQDGESKDQLELEDASKLRDLRLLLKGKLKFFPRLSYTVGYMWDAPNHLSRFRQTGLMLDVPELSGRLFVGRTKEGFSTNKLMVGYNGWTIERAAANDAFLPILADGIKWMGTAFEGKLVYNVGWFIDTLTQYESFNKNDRQFAGRAVWLPFAGTGSGQLLHLAAEVRYAAADNGMLEYRSKPEAFVAQDYAVDTGDFAADHSVTYGLEAYYRRGPLLVGSEYFLNAVRAPESGDPLFHGGEVLLAYLLTGEEREYDGPGGFFEGVVPNRSVFCHGPGAWELVVRNSFVDLDSKAIQGGRFFRVTPMVNWYLSGNVRLEFAYGYGLLDRFGGIGGTQFLQIRLQLQLI